MADSTILAAAKSALRISSSTTAYNGEITDLISACIADLGLVGLLNTVDTDALVKRAIITYCKANFGWNNPDAEKLQQSYEMLRNHLSLSQDYAFFAVTFIVKNASSVVIDEAEIIFNGETKLTNTLGTAIFYARAGNNYEYEITKEGYQDYIKTDGTYYNVDVTASATINITLTTS